MISIRTTSISGDCEQRVDSGPAVFGVQHLDLVPLQDAGEREDVAHVVVHDQHLAAGQLVVQLAELLQLEPLVFGQGAFRNVQDAGELRRAGGRSSAPCG